MKNNPKYSILFCLLGLGSLSFSTQAMASKSGALQAVVADRILNLAEGILNQIPKQEQAEQTPIDPLLQRLEQLSEKAIPFAQTQVYEDTMLGSLYVRKELQNLKSSFVKLSGTNSISRPDSLKEFEKPRSCANVLVKTRSDEKNPDSLVFYFSEYNNVKTRLQSLFKITPDKVDDAVFWMTRPGNPAKVIAFIDRLEKNVEKVSMSLMPHFQSEWQKEKRKLEKQKQQLEKQIPELTKKSEQTKLKYATILRQKGSTSQSPEVKAVGQQFMDAVATQSEATSKLQNCKDDLARINDYLDNLQGKVPSWCEKQLAKK